MTQAAQVLLQVEQLSVHYARGRERLYALDAVSFSLAEGEILAVVGESGSGKSTLARSLLRLTRAESGRVLWQSGGRVYDLLNLERRRLRMLRAELAIVFQDPIASLNPRLRIATALSEVIALRQPGLSALKLSRRVAELLEEVGLSADCAARYPHEFSGGQRQRIAIARALASEPRLLLCDEPLSNLDASLQVQIVQLLADLRRRRGLAVLFIAHDLQAVRHCADRVAVMFAGQMVELAPTSSLFGQPRHPYTQALLAASLRSAKVSSQPVRSGLVASSAAKACTFLAECPYAEAICLKPPLLREIGAAHAVACHLVPVEE